MKQKKPKSNFSKFVGEKIYFHTEWLYSFTKNSDEVASVEVTECTLKSFNQEENSATLILPNGEEADIFLDLLYHHSMSPLFIKQLWSLLK